MNTNKLLPKNNINNLINHFHLKKFRFILVIHTALFLLPLSQAKSDEVFLECTAMFEINRGELIKPDWEISYITINQDRLKSIIYDKGIKKEGSTIFRRGSYTIKYRDLSKRIKTKYKIHATHSTYIVKYPQINKTLIGTCQKGRG